MSDLEQEPKAGEEEEEEKKETPAIDVEELKKGILDEIKPLLEAKKREEEPEEEELPDLRALLAESNEPDEADLESMPRAKFLDYVIDKAEKKILANSIKPLEARLTEISQSVVESRIQEAIARTAAKYDDFWDYKDDMLALTEKYPELPPEHLYLLAKSGKKVPEKKEEKKKKKREIGTPVPPGEKEKEFGSWEDAAKDTWASIEKEME